MIDKNMKNFISTKLKISKKKAVMIQKKFYLEYGTTLFGLMKFYDVNPDEFLKYVHKIDFSKIRKSQKLNTYLNMLPGRKIVFTNGDEPYAKNVLKSIGIHNHFNDIYDIKKGNYVPKPKLETYKNLIKVFRINASKSVFFDDIEKNLEPAHQLGITTVHIDYSIYDNKSKKTKNYIDFKFKCIESALRKFLNLKR